MHDKYIEELKFCLDLWEIQGHCGFGGHTVCEQCASPYLMWKLSTGEILHGKMTRLTLEDWKKKVEQHSESI